jgi:hypothetical protein
MLIRTANGWRSLGAPLSAPKLSPVPWGTFMGHWSDDPKTSPMADKPGWSRSDMLALRAAWEGQQQAILDGLRHSATSARNATLDRPTGVRYGRKFWGRK